MLTGLGRDELSVEQLSKYRVKGRGGLQLIVGVLKVQVLLRHCSSHTTVIWTSSFRELCPFFRRRSRGSTCGTNWSQAYSAVYRSGTQTSIVHETARILLDSRSTTN